MAEERNTDKLAGHLIKIGAFVIIAALCWYFKVVLIYIIIAFVVSLIGRPIMKFLKKIHIKKLHIPDWLSAILTIFLIIGLLVLIITQMVPMVMNIVSKATEMIQGKDLDPSIWKMINNLLVGMFPALGSDFDLKAFDASEFNWDSSGFKIVNLSTLDVSKLSEVVDFSNVPGIVRSIASLVSDIFVGLFAVVFISFFFLKDDGLFEQIICALVPDRIEEKMKLTLNDIKQLLSRYFVGLVIEMLGVALIDFLGLWLIARLDFSYAIGIAFVAGILNVIPYLGPFIGEILGAFLGVILKIGIPGMGLDVNIGVFALIIFAIMLAAQLVDNLVYQPVIYSTSIKAHPLEIFIVLLMAGYVGGMLGMFVAIPAYTVLRVVAIRFFYRFKPIQRLSPDLSAEDKIIDD